MDNNTKKKSHANVQKTCDLNRSSGHKITPDCCHRSKSIPQVIQHDLLTSDLVNVLSYLLFL